ncbi:MAG: glycosyltransferase family 9 protein [Candidatus Melainabacteria bacterium]|nr:glycosyltransferase family 9 protein [Candidatus Melainabacteria bacterium]
MATFANILIFHPGAIGDVILATPVAATIKYNFPETRLSYVTHPNLEGLLSLCNAVDKVIPFKKDAGMFEQRKILAAASSDLIVDLSGSFKSWLLTSLAGTKVLHYAKQRPGSRLIEHAVDNFLASLKPLDLRPLAAKFPTLTLASGITKAMSDRLTKAGYEGQTLIGLVPGVGKLRPHRAWFADGWVTLARHIVNEWRCTPVLVGGMDESLLGQEIASQAGEGCINLVGELSLIETAALLKLCQAVVSGDTGPAHIAVAVGSPVVGLYGPTNLFRSGPYGCTDWLVDCSNQCRCSHLKFCQLNSMSKLGPGECMRQITVQEVLAKLELAIGNAPK